MFDYMHIIKQPISIKCDEVALKSAIKLVIEENIVGYFPPKNLLPALLNNLEQKDLISDYNKSLYDPEFSKEDLMKINKILCNMINDGYLGINLFDNKYSGNNIELFRII